MNKNNTSIGVNALLNTIRTVLGIVFPLLTFPYVSRVLQVEALGMYDFSASIISYFLLLANLGISTYAIREGTKYRSNKQEITNFVNEMFSINMIATFFSYVSLFVILFVFLNYLKSHSAYILILSIQIFFSTLGVSWICNIFEDFIFITVRTLLIQIISLLGIFIFIKSPSDIYKYCAIVTFANSGANILNFIYINNKYCKIRFKVHCNLKKHIKPILIIFATSITMTIYVSSDSTILGLLRTDYEVGLYSAAVKIYTIIKNVLAASIMVLIPRFSILLNKSDKAEANKLFTSIFNILTLILIPATLGLFMESKNIILIVSGEKYIEASNALKLLSIATMFSLYAYMYTQCILIPIKKEKIVFKATLLSAIVNVGLNFVLIPSWGINAAAFTTVIAEAIICVSAICVSRNYIKLDNIRKNILKVGIGCGGIIIFCNIVNELISNKYIALFSAVGGSAVLYFMIQVCLKNEIINRLFVNIMKKKREGIL